MLSMLLVLAAPTALATQPEVPVALQGIPPAEEITLTGSIEEPITVKIGAQTIEVDMLPFKFWLKQEQIPLYIEITSPNYVYQRIYVKKYTKEDYKIARQTGEEVERTYVVKHEPRPAGAAQAAPAVATPKARQLSDVDQITPTQGDMNDKTFAVIIANEMYQEVGQVPYAQNDGSAFRDYCTKVLRMPVENVHYRANATLNNMRSELEWLQKVCTAYGGEARIVFYYAGHGIPDMATGVSYLLPVDGLPTHPETGYSLKSLYDYLGNLPTNQVFVFLDACFSGSDRNDKMLASARGVAIKAKAETPKGNVLVMSAASGDETALPYEEKGHGLFTYYLLKYLQTTKGKAKMGDLATYVATEVGKRSIVVNNKSQTPTVFSSNEQGSNWKSLKLIP